MLNTVNILEGNTFAVSDRRGDMEGSPDQPNGLFSNDTRFLSKWVLTINGIRPSTLSVDETRYYEAQFFMAPSTGTTYIDSPVSVIRKRAVLNGLHEWLSVKNFDSKPMKLNIDLEADADFADLFEVKDAIAKKKGKPYKRIDKEASQITFGYKREEFVRETWVRTLSGNPKIDNKGFHFHITLDPQQEFNTEIDIMPVNPDNPRQWPDSATWEDPSKHLDLTTFMENLPQLQCDWLPLNRIYERSLLDMAALRFAMFGIRSQSLPAAGLPWFMTAFGRDSLITSYQAIPYLPELAEASLLTLAQFQAQRMDDFRDAEPGKILHEFRFGELTAFEESPHSPYYGSADSTTLFLILLDEFERWTGRIDLVKQLEPNARAALEWIDKYGDFDGDGYIEYKRRNEKKGLENQCWKDSWDSIQWADGHLAELPRATCELQGYAYDAKVRCARLAREIWEDEALAKRLEQEAAQLKKRFNEDFWLADKGYYALALDGKKKKVDSLSSNIGHLLWSGIVDDDKAPLIAEHLMGPRLFSGWGIRTFGTEQTGYNPIGYHVGTVWPHDNSIIMLGLQRYGFYDSARRVGMALLEAADVMGSRLPEAFAGFSRADTSYPAEYPTACSPQAWASGAPLLVIRSLLGLTPNEMGLDVNAILPEKIRVLQLQNIPGRWGTTDAGVDMSGIVMLSLSDSAKEDARDTAETLNKIAQRINPKNTIGRYIAVRLDLGKAGLWRIVAENGKVAVDQHDEPADVTLESSKSMLVDVLNGKQEVNTALLSGKMKIHGDTRIALRIIQLLARQTGERMPAMVGRVQ